MTILSTLPPQLSVYYPSRLLLYGPHCVRRFPGKTIIALCCSEHAAKSISAALNLQQAWEHPSYQSTRNPDEPASQL